MSVIAFKEVFSSSSSSSGTEKTYSYTAFLLHGVLGCGDDYADFANSLVTSLSADWRMVLVDLRCHGNSTGREGLSPPHDIANTAKDLADLVKSLDWAWPDVIIGHSMGGKVAYQYALSCARGDYGDTAQIPKQVWTLECGPGKAEDKSVFQDFVDALQTLKTLPSPIPSQEWLVNYMNNLGISEFLSEWISSTLKKSGEHMTFPFDIDGALQMFDSGMDSDYWSLVEEPPKGMEIAIVRTDGAYAWDQDTIERLESLASRESNESRGKVSVHLVPNSGHWIYKDQPEKLLEIMTPRIASLVQLKLLGRFNQNERIWSILEAFGSLWKLWRRIYKLLMYTFAEKYKFDVESGNCVRRQASSPSEARRQLTKNRVFNKYNPIPKP